jgi:hypothetical protein
MNEMNRIFTPSANWNGKPTVEWMSIRYNEMNTKLFNGLLNDCSFSIFTSGKGSQGRILGYFMMKGEHLKVDRYNRRMYQVDYWGDRETIDSDNFVMICKPLIALNGNYSGDEIGFLTTLVHEMCHYYNYMNGFAPKQAHGPEFRHIAETITLRANGLFTIQRLASAEQMESLELSDEMKEKAVRRESNKKISLTAIFEFRKDGEVHLTTTSSKELINKICDSIHSRKFIDKIVLCKDPKMIEILFSHGYKKNMRSWRYWNVEDKDWLNMLDSMNVNVIYNSNNEIQTESKRNDKISNIITEVINRFVESRDNDDSIDIIPGMNYGIESPFGE